MNSTNKGKRQLHWTIIYYTAILLLLTGCSQSFIVTRQGDPLSGENISYDQFNRLREGKYFEMIVKNSSVISITLIRAGVDSIIYETGEEQVRHSIPIDSVVVLNYRQNDNGFNAMIGGFGGLLFGGAAAKSLFDFNDNESSIQGFVAVITSTVTGAVIGYNNETLLAYYFPPQKKKKP